METLTLEHWLDIREAIQRRLKEVASAGPVISEAKAEQARRVNSLTESLGQIEQRVKDLQFENKRRPY